MAGEQIEGDYARTISNGANETTADFESIVKSKAAFNLLGHLGSDHRVNAVDL